MSMTATSGASALAAASAASASGASVTRWPRDSRSARSATRTSGSSSTSSTRRARDSYTARNGNQVSRERSSPAQWRSWRPTSSATAARSPAWPPKRSPQRAQVPRIGSRLTEASSVPGRPADASGTESGTAVPIRASGVPSCSRPAAGLDQAAPERLVARTDRAVEAEPVDDAGVLLLQQGRNLAVRAGDREDLKHLVRDQRRHAAPVALRRFLVEAIAGVAPAVRLEDAAVRARGSVEGELLADGPLRALDLIAVLPHDDERGGRERHLLAAAIRLREPGLQVGQQGFAEVLDRVEGMDVDAVGELAREPAHVGVHGRDVDGNVRPLERCGREERRHQAELVVLPLEAGTRPVLPHVPDVADELDHLAQPRAGCRPRCGVPPLVVALHLRAEAEDEAATRRGLEVPRDLRVHQRAARERDRDVRADRRVIRRARRDRAREVRIVPGLRRPDAVVAELLVVAREPCSVAQIARHEAAVDLHGRPLLEPRRRGQGSVALDLGTAALRARHEDEPEIADALLARRALAERRRRLATGIRRHHDAGASAQRRREVAGARRLDERMATVEEERAQLLPVVEAEGEERAAAVARASERLRERPGAHDRVEAGQDDAREAEMDDGRRDAEQRRGGAATPGTVRDVADR